MVCQGDNNHVGVVVVVGDGVQCVQVVLTLYGD